MTLLLEQPITRWLPTMSRESITWRTIGEVVEVRIELINDSVLPTTPDNLIIEAAAFGAFVPNEPVARIAVGSLDPGERRTEIAYLQREQLDRIAQSPLGAMGRIFRSMFDGVLDAPSHMHFIGNMNVYFESAPERAVERHHAFDLRVPAGSRIGAAFMIKEAPEWTIEVNSSDPEWGYDHKNLHSTCCVLAIDAPREVGRHAAVIVNVTRTNDGRVVPVEFEFETVDGWGEALGCVKV